MPDMGKEKHVHFRESLSFWKRIVDELPSWVDSPSDLYRKAARILLNNPGLLMDPDNSVGTLDEELLESMKDDVIAEVVENRRELEALRLLLVKIFSPIEQDHIARDNAVTRVFRLLLNKDAIFSCETIECFESCYDFDYWREYTPDLLELFVKSGYLKVIDGFRLVWLKKK